jgi:hypothetical protein
MDEMITAIEENSVSNDTNGMNMEWSAREGAQRTNKIDAREGDGQAKPE